VIFFTTGGLQGPVLWAGLLTLLPAAIYFGLQGSLIAAVLFTLVQYYWALSYFTAETSLSNVFGLSFTSVLPLLAALTGINLFVGLVIGVLGQGVKRRLDRTYQAQVMMLHAGERKAQQVEHERMQSFYRLLETLSATLNYQVVLETALELSVAALGGQDSPAEKMSGAVLLFNDGDLKVAAGRRLAAADLRHTFPAERGLLAEIMRTGEGCLAVDPAKDPELSRLVSMQNCRVALALPLRRGLSSFGVMLFAHAEADFFSDERVEALEAISHQAVIAIQNARLYQEVQNEKERIIESEDEARKKLARALHDGPAQSLAAIAMGIDIARRIAAQDPSKAQEELTRLEELARRTNREIRHMLFTLRPLVLESDGLAAALLAMADKMRDTFGQNVAVEADPEVEERMEAGKQTMVFYLAEEAVNNARKHAQASLVTVRLRFLLKDPEVAQLEVVDNGVGFEVGRVNTAYEKRGSLGMVNLRERTELISGVLNIDSAPGRGTCVSVLIPLTEEAVDRLQRGLVSA
jgi:signal transduction histidine kinase